MTRFRNVIAIWVLIATTGVSVVVWLFIRNATSTAVDKLAWRMTGVVRVLSMQQVCSTFWGQGLWICTPYTRALGGSPAVTAVVEVVSGLAGAFPETLCAILPRVNARNIWLAGNRGYVTCRACCRVMSLAVTLRVPQASTFFSYPVQAIGIASISNMADSASVQYFTRAAYQTTQVVRDRS